MTRWLISGSRQFPDEKLARAVFKSQFQKEDIVYHGGASGIDSWAREEAHKKGCTIKQFLPKWDEVGKSAGIRRNATMFKSWKKMKDKRALILWDGVSSGTAHMLSLVEGYGAPLTLIRAGYD